MLRTPTCILTLCMLACSPGDEDPARAREPGGGKADDLDTEVACAKVLDHSRGPSTRTIDPTQLHDPIAQFVLTAAGECPSDWTELAAKLAEHDVAGCDDGAGVRTAVASETAQLTGTLDSFRTVTLRTCGDRPAHGMAFSLTHVGAASEGLPQDVEIIAFDETLGMFAFYTLESGKWLFHGTSKDVVALGSKSRCAACHRDGGLVLKELENPWLHWEGNTSTPGARELVDAHPDLGRHTDAIEIEQAVRAGNRAWDEIWVKDLLLARNLREVLRPLFCTNEFNIGTATKSVGEPARFVPALALVDDAFDGGAFPLQINATPEAYTAAIAAMGQRVEHDGEPVLGTDGEPAKDTRFSLAFVHRARSDSQFVARLEQIGVVDRDFVFDVLAVDFTRPVFSQARCDLLEFVPDVGDLTVAVPDQAAFVAEKFVDVLGNCCAPHDGGGCTGAGIQACVCAEDDFCCTQEWDQLCVAAVGDRGCAACPGREELFATPLVEIPEDLEQRIRDGFVARLVEAAPAEGTPAAMLLANLQAQDDSGAHAQRVADFFAACNARPEGERLADVMHAIAAQRNAARALPLFEFDATLPVDDLDADPATVLDPTTCTLVRP